MDRDRTRLLRAWREEGDEDAALELWALARREDDRERIAEVSRGLGRGGLGWGVRGEWWVSSPPTTRRAWPRPFLSQVAESEDSFEARAFFIDGEAGGAGAIARDGVLCLGWSAGLIAWRFRGQACERLTASTPATWPEWFAEEAGDLGPGSSVFVEPFGPGDRYLVYAGEELGESALRAWLSRASTALEEALSGVVEETGASLALLLQVDRGGGPLVGDAREYFEALNTRGYGVTYVGNERGDGFLGVFDQAPPEDTASGIEEALLEVARQTEMVHYEIGAQYEANPEYAEDPLGGAEPGFEPLVPGDASRGWFLLEGLEAFAENLRASRGSYLDASTRQARLAETHVIPGEAIITALRGWVEPLGVVALHSSPNLDESVVGIHLLGGRDRATGRLQGVILIRIWT